MRAAPLLALALLAAAPLTAQTNAPVVINEFCYDNGAADNMEYVELFNTTAQDIDLSGWALDHQDAYGPIRKFVFPSGTKIKARGFYVLGSPLVPNVDWALSPATEIWKDSNEDLALLDGASQVVDAVAYEANKLYWPAARFETEGIWGNFTGTRPANRYDAILIGRNAVPPAAGAGYGRAVVFRNAITQQWVVRVAVRNLAATGAALRLGKAGTTGPVILALSLTAPSEWSGSVALTAAELTSLQAGDTYIEVSTAANPAGEIRDQVRSIPTTSCSRRQDGLDTGNNGRDFILLPSTPGMPNAVLGPVAPIYKDTFDAATPETPLPAWAGSFAEAYVIDPTIVSANNPNAIAASPQGGNAAIFWDSAGGGNANVLLIGGGAGRVVVEGWVYFDATPEPAGENETWSLGAGGTTCTYYNTPDPGGSLLFTANGNTGVAWTYQVTSQGAFLYLMDHFDGGWGANAKSGPTLLGRMEVKKGVNDGWQRLRLELHGSKVLGSFGGNFGCADGTTFAGNLSWASPDWGVYVGYREGLAVNPTARPFTVDDLTVRFPGSEIAAFGTAAATTRGTPALDPNGPPTLGFAGWALGLAGLVPNGSGILVLGTMKLNPPLGLAPLGGQPGSSLHLLPLLTFGVAAGAQGTASFPAGLPCDPLLLGGRVYWQHFDLDPALPGLLKLGNSSGLETLVGN